MKAKKFFGFDEKFGYYAAISGLVIITLIFCGEHFGWFGDDRYEELKKSHREKVNLLTIQNQIQARKINELKEQLRILESSTYACGRRETAWYQNKRPACACADVSITFL